MSKYLVPLFLLFLGCGQPNQLNLPTTKDNAPPSEVTNLVLTPGDRLVVLTWTDPPDSDFDSIQILVNGVQKSVAKGSQTLTVSDLANGSPVSFRIRTLDTSGNLSEGITRTATPEPNGFTVSFDVRGGSAVPAQTGLASGSLITPPVTPTKSGSAFAGWFRDPGFTTKWDVAVDTVTANITLYARWGSGSAVGLWFALQNGVSSSVDPSVDNMESILHVRADGTYSFYQRRHAALASSYWVNLDENAFYEVLNGTYFWDPSNQNLTFTHKLADVIRLGLMVGSLNEASLTTENVSWPSTMGLKTLAEAQSLWATRPYWSSIQSLYQPIVNKSAAIGSDTYTNYDGTVRTLEFLPPGQASSNRDIWPQTYLDVTRDETRGGFRVPNSTTDFPQDIRSLLPTPPTAAKAVSLSVTSPSGNYLYGFTNGISNGTPYYQPIPLAYTASGVASVQYRLNGGSWTTATSGLDLASAVKSKFGIHTLEVRGLDGTGSTVASRTVEFYYFNVGYGSDGGMTGQVQANWSAGSTVTSPAINQYQGTSGTWGSSSTGGAPTVSNGYVTVANQAIDGGGIVYTNFTGRTTLPSLGGFLLPLRDLPYNIAATSQTQNYVNIAFMGFNTTTSRLSQLGAALAPQAGGVYVLMLFTVVTDTISGTTTYVQLGGTSNFASFTATDWTPPSFSGTQSRYVLGFFKEGSTYWAFVLDESSITVSANNKPTNHVSIVAKVSFSGTTSIADTDLLGLGTSFKNSGTVPTRFPMILGLWK